MRGKKLSQRKIIIAIVVLLALVVAIIWILSSLAVIPKSWAAISSIIVAVFGSLFAFLQSLHIFLPADTSGPSLNRTQKLQPDTPQIPPSDLQPLISQPLHTQSSQPEKASYRGIVGLPPPTDARTIQQRENIVKDIYAKLIKSNITAIALTGIGGVGKSTLAALVYRYVEEHRKLHPSPFVAETLWLVIDPAVTFADIAGNLFEALGKDLPDLSSLAPQNQAVALFNALNTADRPRLIVLDQFENLLSWDTGHALTDRPGVAEWIDIINSQNCSSRILLTSRPRPIGTREYPLTYLQEYPVGGLEVNEGIALLQSQNVQGTDSEKEEAVTRCSGHAFSLTLLATLLRGHNMSLSVLFLNPLLWTGDVATNLLDQIYTQQLTDIQRELLVAFSLYREPVPLNAALAVMNTVSNEDVSSALKVLLTQHLLEAVGEGRYKLHAIIADYAQNRLNLKNAQTNESTLQEAHRRSALYYLQRAASTCPPRKKRRGLSDVHDLIETIWHFCHAEQWQDAYNLMQREHIFIDLSRWGGNAILQELYELLLPLDKWNPDHSQAANIYYNLGWIYSDKSNLERALDYYEHALILWKEIRNEEEEGITLNSMGWVNRDLGRYEQAEQCLLLSLEICRNVGNRQEEGRALNNLGTVYYDLGQRVRSQEYFELALVKCREGNDLWGESWTLNNLGRVFRDLRKKGLGLEYFERALDIRKEIGNRQGEGRTFNNLGTVYRLLGQNEQALKCCEVALNISREIGDLWGEGWALLLLGLISETLQQNEQAMKYYEQALYVWNMTGMLRGKGRTLTHIGWAYHQEGKRTQAWTSYQRGLNILRKVKDRWAEGETFLDMGALYFLEKRYNLAFAALSIAKSIFLEVESPLNNQVQTWIDKIHQIVGDEQFAVLLALEGPQQQNIVEQTLQEDSKISSV